MQYPLRHSSLSNPEDIRDGLHDCASNNSQHPKGMTPGDPEKDFRHPKKQAYQSAQACQP